LMNLLSGTERSIVTPVAGTTRDIIRETVNLGDITLNICDTAETDNPARSAICFKVTAIFTSGKNNKLFI